MTSKTTILLTALSAALLIPTQALALSKEDASTLAESSETTLEAFQKETSDSTPLIDGAKGILVCPKITKGGFIAGIQSGKCSLMVDGAVVNYYRTSAAKFGFLAGVETYSMILLFTEQAALDTFRAGDREWEVGADASVAVAKIGAGGSIDTTNLKQAIVAFLFGQKGLMADLSLNGTTFKKIEVED